ncbi:MAG: DUF1349 domain-containing protein [Sedimentisphaerales bacterium]|nr:DUF1349 domain-containing protein [Sedimentisphaerales bacterium]
MKKTVFYLFLLLALSFAAIADSDGFNEPHNYLTSGASGTVFDNYFVNGGVSGTQNGVISTLDTNTTIGTLRFATSNTNWEHGDDDGALLWHYFTGDFTAKVQITDGKFQSMQGQSDYLSAGLMARSDNAGNRDWIALFGFDHPEWNQTYMLRSTDGGSSATYGGLNQSLSSFKWQRLVRTGNTFTAYYSADNVTWWQFAQVTRPDMPSTVQVGLAVAQFGSNTGWVEFDNLSITAPKAGKSIYWSPDFNTKPELTSQRSRQSDNFVIYWGEKCGLDPTTASDPALRFDPARVLEQLEIYYSIYINHKKWLDDSWGNLSQYKIILIMNDTWNGGWWTGWAFGSHYDGVIGAMWIHPAGCGPRSVVLAHEFAHSLQNQSWIQYPNTGFQHYSCGFFWEAHANYMMLQCFPDKWHATDQVNFLNHQHCHYGTPRHRYQNQLFMQYIEDKRGANMINRIWRESTHSEHPLQAYMRLTGMSQSQLNDEFGEYAMKNVNFDYSIGTQYRNEFANNYVLQNMVRRFTMLEEIPSQPNVYRTPYYIAPQDYGYNIVQLDPDDSTTTIDLKFYGQRNDPAGGAEYRFGFVAVDTDTSTSRKSQVYSASGGTEKSASFTMQANEEELYLVVLGAPAAHHNYYWEQGWPKYYRYPWQIQIIGATPFVNNHKTLSGSYHPNGGGFIQSGAYAAPTAYVGPNAMVTANGRVEGNARIEDMAAVIEQGIVKDNAILRHAAYTGWSTVKDSAVLSESVVHLGVTVGGTYAASGDAEGHGDCYSGYYRQSPSDYNDRTPCDGLTSHWSNDDINPFYQEYIFPRVVPDDEFEAGFCNGGVNPTQNATLWTPPQGLSNQGELYYQHTNTNWEHADDDGAFYYKTITGNFSMSVQITDGTFPSMSGRSDWHSAGLMARNPNASAVDWVALFGFDHPEWNMGYIFRSTDAGSSTSTGGLSSSLSSHPWLRLMRYRKTFYAYYSADGINWTQFASVTRNDIPDTLQVGIALAEFGSNVGWVKFNNFSLSDIDNYWDGMIVNDGVNATQDGSLVYNSTTSNNGTFTLQTTRTNWEHAADDGVLCHEYVTGNFDARVRIADGTYPSMQGQSDWLSAGLMARNPDRSAVDRIANFAFDHASWGMTYMTRSTDNGSSSNTNTTWESASLSQIRWQRMIRDGEWFSTWYSTDGVNWTNIAYVHRPDLPAMLQVGIGIGQFGTNTGSVTFDNFTIQ